VDNRNNMKKNIILKSIFTSLLLILFFSISLIFKSETIFAQGVFNCVMGETGVWDTNGRIGCSPGYTTALDSCQGNCEALSSGSCNADFGDEITIQCVPVSEECSPGSITNDFENPCVCSPPKTTVGQRVGSGNLYCVNSCLSGSSVYADDNDISPACFCSPGNDMSVNDEGVCISDNAPTEVTNEVNEGSEVANEGPGFLDNSATSGIFHCTDDAAGNWSINDNSCNDGYMADVTSCFDACVYVMQADGGAAITPAIAADICQAGNVSSVTVDCVTDPDYNAGAFGSGSGGNTVTSGDFDALNPLKVANQTEGAEGVSETLTTPGAIISRLLEFSFPLAGLILFIMLFWGGFEITYGASTSKSMEAGKNRITAALIGFFLLFASFWIIQILEEILGITIFL
jgi:hypothetical protein